MQELFFLSARDSFVWERYYDISAGREWGTNFCAGRVCEGAGSHIDHGTAG